MSGGRLARLGGTQRAQVKARRVYPNRLNRGISDLHTCLKLLPAALFRERPVSENRFGLDTGLTALILVRGVRPFTSADRL
jgi:hypothetical protein